MAPTLLRVLQLLLGFLATLCLAVIISYFLSFLAGFSWEPVPGIGLGFLFRGFYNTFQSVLLEELLFRGYLLYKTITLMGEKKANLFSAAAFGIYHWFTLEVLGNPVVMMWVFVYTGLWGLMFSYAYSRTGSLAFPVGLHWGWDFIDQIIFNQRGGSLFSAVTSVHTRYLSNLESMLFLQLPVLAFAVCLIVLLTQRAQPVNFPGNHNAFIC
ncbi:CPBP family intramembrane glutamic endopeptidase [Pontibacter brevis]